MAEQPLHAPDGESMCLLSHARGVDGAPQSSRRNGIRADDVAPLPNDRTVQGLRIVVVERSADGDDVVAVCDGHGMHRWFSGVLTRDDAERAVCERCLEERLLHARRELIVGAYGWNAWLRVIGRR